MIRRLRALAVAAGLGGLGGAAFGVFVGVMNRILFGWGLGISIVLEGARFGALSGALFGLGLMVYGRRRGGAALTARSSTLIGSVVGPSAFFLDAALDGIGPDRFLAWEGVGIAVTYAALGAGAGWALAALYRRGVGTIGGGSSAEAREIRPASTFEVGSGSRLMEPVSRPGS